MTISIEVYEDWGTAIGTPAKGTNRTKVTNANLKSIMDPAQHYYLNDITRPPEVTLNSTEIASCSFTRYLSFKISGTYSRIKNTRIIIPKGFASDNWRVSYRLTNSYEMPTGTTNSLNRYVGNYDGRLMPLTEDVTLFPNLSVVGPEQSTTRPLTVGPNTTVWTQYLVLQFMAHASTYDDIGNEGTETIQLILDELEI